MSQLEFLRSGLPDVSWEEIAPRTLPLLPAPGFPLKPVLRALRGAERPLVLVNDRARIWPRHLADVLQDLHREAKERTRFLVATGTHAAKPAQYRDLLGGLPVEVHDAQDEAAHEQLGEWRFDGRVLAADLVVAIGSVEPHYFAGWTGAHKTCTVGVWARATTEANHRRALEGSAQPLTLSGNPVYEGVAAAADALASGRRLLALNHVLDGDGRPLHARVGTWQGSLQRCLGAARKRFVHEVVGPIDVLVAQVEGPLSRSLYQADKGLKNHEAVVRDGGDLVLVAPLDQGVGPERFLDLLKAAPDLASAERQVAEAGYRLGDHKAVRWRALEARGVRIHLVSEGLDPEAVGGTGLQVMSDLESVCAHLREEGRGRGKGLWVRDAGLVVSTLAEEAMRE